MGSSDDEIDIVVVSAFHNLVAHWSFLNEPMHGRARTSARTAMRRTFNSETRVFLSRYNDVVLATIR